MIVPGKADTLRRCVRSRFDPCFPADAKHDARIALHEMATYNLMHLPLRNTLLNRQDSSEDAGLIMCHAPEHNSVPVVDDGQTDDNDFSRRFNQLCPSETKPKHDEVEAQPYLHSLFRVALPNGPGQLAGLVQELHDLESTSQVDLALVASENRKDLIFVYLLDRQALPQVESSAIWTHGQLLEGRLHSSAWIERLRKAGLDAIEIKAFMVAIRHRQGSLLEVLSKLRGTPPDINLEQVFAFPLNPDVAIAILVVRQDHWHEVLCRLHNRRPTPQQVSKPIKLHGKSVELGNRFIIHRHTQQVIFDIALEPDSEVEFQCPDLATWTPTRGAIENWIAEIGFSQVRLQIPTSLVWQITALGWVSTVPLIGKYIKRALQRRVSGIAGLAEYRKPDKWWMVSKEHDQRRKTN